MIVCFLFCCDQRQMGTWHIETINEPPQYSQTGRGSIISRYLIGIRTVINDTIRNHTAVSVRHSAGICKSSHET